LVERHADAGDSNPRAGVDVLLDHLTRVHPVDVIGAEDTDVVGALLGDDLEVLVDRVGRAGEPARAAAHLGRHRAHVAAEQRRQPPRPGDVQIQAVALVLREHDDLEVAAIGEVRQHEVDQPVMTTEGDRRLSPVGGEGGEPLARPPGENQRQHAGIRPWRLGDLGHGSP
jgi:hypothetical protein